MIKRYRLEDPADGCHPQDAELVEREDGDWCRWGDHVACIPELEAENDALRKEIDTAHQIALDYARERDALKAENARLKAKLKAAVEWWQVHEECPPRPKGTSCLHSDDASVLCTACWDKWKEE